MTDSFGLDFDSITFTDQWNPKFHEVGVVVPCHKDDRKTLLPYCLHGLHGLNPTPEHIFVDVNDGSEGLRVVRKRLFDEAFSHGCDAVLQCSVDFYLKSDILKYVSVEDVVSFTPLFCHPCDFTMAFHRLFLPHRTWSGCYSLPRVTWLKIRDRFDGTDTSVCRAVKRWQVRSFKYRLLRPYREDTTRALVRGFPLGKRLLWQLLRMKAIA